MAHNLGAHFGCMEPRNVRWAHAVNSSQALADALADGTIHMIEADVMLRVPQESSPAAAAAWRRAGSDVVAGLDRDVTVRDVIMCHPPAVDSDLSFDAFFKQVFLAVKGGRKIGLKLDFKHANAVPLVLRVLRDSQVGCHPHWYKGAHSATRTMPLWLNADVIKGPGGREPIPGETFVRQCVFFCPTATLSLGWTHSGTPWLGYTGLQIKQMCELVENVKMHVTFAMSAAHLFATRGRVRNETLAMLRDAKGVEEIETEDAVPKIPSLPTSPTKNGWPLEGSFEPIAVPNASARTITLWGPATSGVRRWVFRNCPANLTFLDVKECNALESAVVGAHVWARPRSWC